MGKKEFSLLLLSMILIIWGVSIAVLYHIEKFLLLLFFSEVFETITKWWILSNDFYTSLKIIVFFLTLLINHTFLFSNVCISGIRMYWFWKWYRNHLCRKEIRWEKLPFKWNCLFSFRVMLSKSNRREPAALKQLLCNWASFL